MYLTHFIANIAGGGGGVASPTDIFFANDKSLPALPTGDSYLMRFDPTTDTIYETQVDPDLQFTCRAVGWDGDQTVVLGGRHYNGSSYDSCFYCSTDGGATISKVSDGWGSVKIPYQILYDRTNGFFFAGSLNNGYYWRSADGVTWVEITSGIPGVLAGATCRNPWIDSNDRIYICGSTYIYYTDDCGDNWSLLTNTMPAGRTAVAYANGYYVVGGSNSFAHHSTDAVSWTATPTFSPAGTAHSIVYDPTNDLFYAGAGTYTYYNSTAGLAANSAWTAVSNAYLGITHTWANACHSTYASTMYLAGWSATGGTTLNSESRVVTLAGGSMVSKAVGTTNLLPADGTGGGFGIPSSAAIRPGQLNPAA